jgi:hypothetical protein
MTCPKCRAAIDDDSFFCDQCGNEINVCPKCGKAGRGKVCTEDGTRLVPAKVQKGRVEERVSDTAVAAPVPVALSDEPGYEAITGSHSSLLLFNKSLGINIEAQHGDILGRTTGRFADLLGAHKQISGQHARIIFDPATGWCIEDVGSTNGTKVNGVKISKDTPQSLADGCRLMIASVELVVRIETAGDPSRTMRS